MESVDRLLWSFLYCFHGKAIKVQTPAYSEGGLENKYEMIGQIGMCAAVHVFYACVGKRDDILMGC